MPNNINKQIKLDEEKATSLKQKFVLIGLGIVLSFLILEIGLNIGGFIILRAKINSLKKAQNGQKTVLCIGDSFIFGQGASQGHDFPSLLENFLENKFGKGRIKVINKGIPGWNSSMVVNRFEENIKEYTPFLVIILVGSMDDRNPVEVDISLISSGAERFKYYLESSLFRIKTFRLIDVLLQSITNKKTVRDRTCLVTKSGNSNVQPIVDEKYASLIATGDGRSIIIKN